MLVILFLGATLTVFAGSHVDQRTGGTVNNFLNTYTLIQTATDASFFAIMAVGATVVIISGGIDLSVGSVYALAGVTTAMVLRLVVPMAPVTTALRRWWCRSPSGRVWRCQRLAVVGLACTRSSSPWAR